MRLDDTHSGSRRQVARRDCGAPPAKRRLIDTSGMTKSAAAANLGLMASMSADWPADRAR